MSRYVSLLAAIDQNGKSFMIEQRNALRTAYMQAKGSTKMHGWTVNDDHSFEAIDLMVANLATDAGFRTVPQQQPPVSSRPTVTDAEAITGDQSQA